MSGSVVQLDLRGSRLENTKLYGADLSEARLPVGVGRVELPMFIRVAGEFMPDDGEMEIGIGIHIAAIDVDHTRLADEGLAIARPGSDRSATLRCWDSRRGWTRSSPRGS